MKKESPFWSSKKMMEKIEYHLTYINFHYECGLLATGQYDKLPEVIKNW